MSDEAKLIAGTIVSFSTNIETPSYTEIPKITSVGSIGLQSEAKEATTLSDTQKVYYAGIQDAPDKTVKGQYLASNSDQAAFITACKNRTQMLMKIEFPDVEDGGTTGTIATFLFQPLGFELDEGTAEDWMMFTINGKQNSQTWANPA